MPDTPEQTTALRALREANNLRRNANRAAALAEHAEEEAVILALRARLGRTRITHETGLAESKIRTIRINNNIPPDPRYAHLRPPVPGKHEETTQDPS
jgi:hypothetical protein